MFKLQFETDNAAFGETDCETFQQIATVLIDLRRRMQAEAAADDGGTRMGKWIEPVRDINGNTIGSFTCECLPGYHKDAMGKCVGKNIRSLIYPKNLV